MNKYTFNADEIFVDIPDDPDNVIMKIPPEIIKETGWKEGDTLNVELVGGGIAISKV